MTHANGAAAYLPWEPSANGHLEPAPEPLALQPILVADNQEVAAAVVAQLKKLTGQTCAVRGYDGGAAVPARLADPIVLLLATNGAELERARLFVQEVNLQKLACIVILLTLEGCRGEAIGELEEYVSHVLLWPTDLATLADVLRNHQPARRRNLLAYYPEGSVEEEIAARLLVRTPSLLPLVEKLALAAEHDVTVLMTGETGTGKTFLARLIHDFSPRSKERILIVPCGALSPNLVESEFFGHVKGAFTGADRPKIGKFAAVGQGTLLLDEIDALPLEQQANLLRVVETCEYEPVGSTETQLSQCRLIVASNRNLRDEADRGRFRQDLYFRLNVMSFHLPALRERIDDVEPLVRAMTARFNTKFRKDLYEISSEVMAVLEAYSWPGNVRELENAIQHAVLVSQGPRLLVQHLPEVIREQTAASPLKSPAKADTLVRNREVVERSVIQRALANHGNSRARAATELGISRVTLYKKMKKYGLMNDSQRTTV
jgi:DNA-binding NtrC family response regulator